jgi:hypothetical protein
MSMTAVRQAAKTAPSRARSLNTKKRLVAKGTGELRASRSARQGDCHHSKISLLHLLSQIFKYHWETTGQTEIVDQ